MQAVIGVDNLRVDRLFSDALKIDYQASARAVKLVNLTDLTALYIVIL